VNVAVETGTVERRARDVYRLIWRWHFYAGLFCIPFVLWLATTGSIYLFKPQIEALFDRPYDHVDALATRMPPSAQVAAALAAVPGGTLNAYELPASPTAAARVLVGKGRDLVRVYVDPTDARVLHQVREDARLMPTIFHLHGELLLGDRGSMVMELAASWTIVMILSGLYLWWPRHAGLAGVLYPRLGQRGRPFWRDLHAVAGIWISVFALALIASGLPWAKSWGSMLTEVRQWQAAGPVKQDWTTGSSAELAQRLAANTPVSAHAGMAGMDMDMPGMAMAADNGALDRLVPTVAALQLATPVLIAPPSHAAAQWSARSDAQNRPLRVTLVLDGDSGHIVKRTDFDQRPLLDRVIGYGVAAHEGQLFGWANQLLALFTTVGLITASISGLVMWWRRRPVGRLGAPPAHGRHRYPWPMLGLLVLLGIVLPLLGATMILVWIIERLVLRRISSLREFFGLGAT
jgi:uncharacterized iron-regulated membrane protein